MGGKVKGIPSIGLLLSVFILAGCASKSGPNRISRAMTDPRPYQIPRHQSPEFLEFHELTQLVTNPVPRCELGEKLDQLWNTPIIDNEAYYTSGIPGLHDSMKLGPFLRVMSWNIEKSVYWREAVKLFTDPPRYRHMLDTNDLPAEARQAALEERALLDQVDILLLQEMDIGHHRSGYHNVPEAMARALGMNYAYGTAQLEIDPVYLGMNHIQFENSDVHEGSATFFRGEKKHYRGAFGSAVLSRFPIKRVEVRQLENNPYNWYTEEIKKPDVLEKGRRIGSDVLFKHQPVREVKVGGRIYMRVDLHVPGVPMETLSVINVHLEIKTTPKERAKQVEEILALIKDIPNPVVFVGDFNASPVDVSSTSISRAAKRTVTNPSHLLSAVLTFAAEMSGLNQARVTLNYLKNYANPFAPNIPVLLPNRLKPSFDPIYDFRFSDGGAFDFRGDPTRSHNGSGRLLANSNERYFFAFRMTFRVPRPLGPFGKYRLDWLFVKSFLSHPEEPNATYRLAPHNGRTLRTFNRYLVQPISDHDPIMCDLPLNDPHFPRDAGEDDGQF